MTYDPSRHPFVRAPYPSRVLEKPFVAFDFETTPIPKKRGDPLRVEVNFITAFADDYGINQPIEFSQPIVSLWQLSQVLCQQFFTPRRNRTRFIAWNAGRFDYRPIVEAIVAHLPQYVVHPYDASSGPRGFLVTHREFEDLSWEICDGIAMTGCKVRLQEFVDTFSPHLPKLVVDLSNRRFDPQDQLHVAYAQRDARTLYEAMKTSDQRLRELTGRGLQVTIGNAGIKYFAQQLPADVEIWEPPKRCLEALLRYGVRGGFCYTADRYMGPVWTYDRNGAYPGAMRSHDLPAGRCYSVRSEVPDRCGLYFCTLWHPGGAAAIPFYCTIVPRVGEPVYRATITGFEPVTTCLLSNEIAVLRRHGWRVVVQHGWYWERSFRMADMVDSLEALRAQHGRSPIGTLVKMLGNHGFGKTLERHRPERIVICAENPSTPEQRWGPWFPPYVRHDDERFACYWYALCEDGKKVYHRPQIGAFVTAGARCDLFDAAHVAPAAFLKCDTDSVSFSRPIEQLHAQLHPTRYGALKLESDGDEHIILGKKGYFNVVRQQAVAAGLHADRLTEWDFRRWYAGTAPKQEQVHLLGWRRGFVPGQDQYEGAERTGSDFA